MVSRFSSARLTFIFNSKITDLLLMIMQYREYFKERERESEFVCYMTLDNNAAIAVT